MVVRKGQDGVQYLFTEDTFGDHADQTRVKAEVCISCFESCQLQSSHRGAAAMLFATACHFEIMSRPVATSLCWPAQR